MNSRNDTSRFDNAAQTKINAAKSNRTDYRIVVQGEEPVDAKKVFTRLNIVVTKDGKFVKTYYG